MHFKVNFLFSIVLLLSQKQALEELKQTVQQLRCSEAKFAAQKELLEQKVQENDGKEPPPVVNYEEDARSVTSMVSFTDFCSLAIMYCSLDQSLMTHERMTRVNKLLFAFSETD